MNYLLVSAYNKKILFNQSNILFSIIVPAQHWSEPSVVWWKSHSCVEEMMDFWELGKSWEYRSCARWQEGLSVIDAIHCVQYMDAILVNCWKYRCLISIFMALISSQLQRTEHVLSIICTSMEKSLEMLCCTTIFVFSSLWKSSMLRSNSACINPAVFLLGSLCTFTNKS